MKTIQSWINIKSLANEVACEILQGQWKVSSVDNGSNVFYFRSDAPGWIKDIVAVAHGYFTPDNWRLEAIREVCEHISEIRNDASHLDDNIDFNSLTSWLASNDLRVGYVDSALSKIIHGTLNCDSTLPLLEAAQFLEYQEIYDLLMVEFLTMIEI